MNCTMVCRINISTSTNILFLKPGGELNDCEVLACQAVVEGEATYIMTLWSMQKILGMVPDREILKMSIYLQEQTNTEMMIAMLKSGSIGQFQQTEMANDVQTIEKISAFIIETMISAYQKGMRFVFICKTMVGKKSAGYIITHRFLRKRYCFRQNG